jgi:peptidoglycan/LPS O-acetylase OafA/YrhL
MIVSHRTEMQLRPLTSIRFLFALLVVVFHGQDTLKQGGFDDWPLILRLIVSHGYVGVSFFFVLSGFILAYSYKNKLDQPRDSFGFWGARFARIYPAYALAFLIMLPIAVYGVSINGDRHAVLTAGLQLTLTQSWVPYTALQWNVPAWSLSVEAFFYALFPVLFLRAKHWSMSKLMITAVLAYFASQIIALIAWRYGTGISDAINQGLGLQGPNEDARTLFFVFFPPFRLPEFIFGMALGILFGRISPLAVTVRRWMIFIGCTGFIFGFMIISPLVPVELFSNGLLMPFLALIIVSLAYSPSWLFNHPVFVQLGDASYSLYLLHIPLWNWMARTDRHLGNWLPQFPKLFFFTYVAFTIIASLVSLHLIETPARVEVRRWLRRLKLSISSELANQ